MEKDPERFKHIKSIFKADTTPDDDFHYFFADIFAGFVQSRKSKDLCEKIATMPKDITDERFQKLHEFAVEMGHSPDDYATQILQEEEIHFDRNMRQWTYQVCTEVGYFQTPNMEHRLRSKHLNMGYWYEFCQRVFGPGITPRVNYTNTQYGDTRMRGSNIIHTNGDEDPWKWATIRSTNESSPMDAEEIMCPNCAHCIDLGTPSASDHKNLTDARVRIQGWVAKKLGDVEEDSNTGMIIGIVIGSVVGLIVLGVIAFYVGRKCS